MVVPAVTPVPLIACPTATIAPEAAVTVRMVPAMLPVTLFAAIVLAVLVPPAGSEVLRAVWILLAASEKLMALVRSTAPLRAYPSTVIARVPMIPCNAMSGSAAIEPPRSHAETALSGY